MDNKHLSNASQKNGPRANNFLSLVLYPILNALVLAANIPQVKSTRVTRPFPHMGVFYHFSKV